MLSKKEIVKLSEIYTCNRKKNIKCKANNCCINDGLCYHTTDWKYAKRTPVNYIKRLINILRGKIMERNKKYNDTYKINLEINKEEILKDIRDIKKEVKETTKEIEFEINKLQLKRRDILVIKTNALFRAEDLMKIKEKLEKQLHRRVLVIDNSIDISHVISYRKR